MVSGKYIKKIPTKVLRDAFLSSFQVENGELRLECGQSTNYIGTSCVVNLVNAEQVSASYKTIVRGDVTGDGLHTLTDIVKVLKYSSSKTGLNQDAFIQAADIDYDGSVSRLDAQILSKYTLENTDIPLQDSKDESDEAKIILSTNSLTLNKGDTSQIEAKLSDDSITIIEWKSADESIAVVDSTGLITGVGAGTTKITVTASNGETADVEVVVKVNILPTGIILDFSRIQLALGDVKKLIATVSPNDATDTTVTWTSGNSAIATVDSLGNVTGKSVGTTTITATTVNGFSQNCTVIVTNNLEIDFSSSDDQILMAGTDVSYLIRTKKEVESTIDSTKIHLYTQSPITYELLEYENYSVSSSGDIHNIVFKVPTGVSNLGLFRIVMDAGAITDTYGNVSPAYSRDDFIVSLELNATAQNDSNDEYKSGSAAISMAVGVDNSFYAKSYSYYVNDTVVKNDSTTNAYVYSDSLTNGNTYQIKVEVTLYKDRLIHSGEAYYSSQTGNESSIEKLTDDTIKGTVTKSITIPTSVIDQKLTVDFIDTSETVEDHGDAIFMRANNKTILVDTGSNTVSDGETQTDGYRIIQKIKELTNSDTCVIDYLMLTHTDLDHTGGAGEIFDGCTVNNVVVSVNHYNGYEGIFKLGASQKQMLPIDKALENHINLITLTAGNVLNIGGIIFNIFSPYNNVEVPSMWLNSESEGGVRENIKYCDYYQNADSSTKVECDESHYYDLGVRNENSLVFHTMLGSRKLLLTGDAEFGTEEFLLGKVSSITGIKISDAYEVVSASDRTYVLNSTQSMSLLKDISSYEGITTEQAVAKYKLNRFTAKNVQASIMKKAHHAYLNTTSIDFLNSVAPYIIIVTGSKYENQNMYSEIPYLRNIVENRIKTYYATKKEITITSSNWKNYIFVPASKTTVDFDRGVTEISTYGRQWDR